MSGGIFHYETSPAPTFIALLLDHIFVAHMPAVPLCADLGVLFFRISK